MGAKSSRQMTVHKTGRKERRQEERERESVKGEPCARVGSPVATHLYSGHTNLARGSRVHASSLCGQQGIWLSVKLAQGRPQGLGGGVGLWNLKGGRDFSELEPEGSCSSSQQLFWK